MKYLSACAKADADVACRLLSGVRMKNYVVAGILMACFATSAWAIPFLQLDVAGVHHYDPVTETIIADSNPFDVLALIDANNASELGRTYYLSAAVVPNPGYGSNFGSFVLMGNTYNSGNMFYGVPPVDDALKNIAQHDVFPTYYTELSFTFSSLAHTTIPAYNSADGSLQAGNTFYAFDFLANVSGLAAANSIHFDLYTYDNVGNKIDAFAPFSHDAQSGTHGIVLAPPPRVPDGGSTLFLLGTALAGLGALRRKFGWQVE